MRQLAMAMWTWRGGVCACLAALCLAGCAAGGGGPAAAVPPPEMVQVPAGEFLMGAEHSPAEVVKKGGGEEKYYLREHPRHRVVISRGFRLAVTPVTNQQFAAFVAATGHVSDAERQGTGQVWKKGWVAVAGADWRHPTGPESSIQGRGQHPVVQVSWHDANAYCAWLSGLHGQEFYLPSEAQWEYAARAGTATPFYTGPFISTDQANYFGRRPYDGGPVGIYRQDSAPVGSFAANPWGLKDMHGNVWQWCADWFDAGYYAVSPASDPPGPAQGSERVLRGGAWNLPAQDVRSARRYGRPPGLGHNLVGFRVAGGGR
ncbi:MAG: formylglycine-generating enzyme family protein [Desulfarculus sp.]|nr:formylglycine-generating enzyme family protein [Desulfarculus sp.]